MSLKEYRAFRERMNERILEADNLDIRRFFALDSRVYEDGALPTPTKELLGLVASLVLRCDDCVTYHLVRCAEDMANVIFSRIHGVKDPRFDPGNLTPEQRERYARYREKV